MQKMMMTSRLMFLFPVFLINRRVEADTKEEKKLYLKKMELKRMTAALCS
jgi:hypothetical protein